MPFNPSDELEMLFTVAEWNQIIAQLNEGVYRIVHPLINKINLQAAQHEHKAAEAATKTAEAAAMAQQHRYTNGELHSDTTLVPTGDIVVVNRE